MPKQKKLYFSRCEIDGRCVTLLLTEKEIVNAAKRCELKENEKFLIEENMIGSCWPVEKPPKCSIWNKLLGRCDCKE
jgi:hypothetical protein